MRISSEQIRLAEKSVLASAFMESWAAKKAADTLTEKDFAYPANRAIFSAMQNMERAGQPIDFVTISNEVEGNPDVQDYGGLDYLLELVRFRATAVNVEHYIALVTEYGREARIVREAAGILKNDDPAIPQLERLIERERATMQRGGSGYRVMEEIEGFISDLQNPDPSRLIKTGFPTLDDKLGGLERGLVGTIASRPSAGKTALALNILVAAVTHGSRSVFFSMEMSSRKILGRLGASLAKVDNSDIKRRRVSRDKTCDLSTELVSLASGERFHLYDNVRTVGGIREEVARISPALVIVDYLQLVQSEQRAENENYKLGSIIQEFKRLARVHDCFILYLSQIGRAGDAKPTLKDLYGSGAIEQASDVILALDRPFIRDKSNPESEASLSVLKNKDGECGTIRLYFDGAHQQFTEEAAGYGRRATTRQQQSREPGEDDE